MRIQVDRNKCEGLGMCEASPPEADRSKVHAAVEACPALALTLVG